jgi:hypothetical protein
MPMKYEPISNSIETSTPAYTSKYRMGMPIMLHEVTHKNSVLTERFYLLRYNVVWSVGSQLTLQRNMSPPSSGSKNKPSKKPA